MIAIPQKTSASPIIPTAPEKEQNLRRLMRDMGSVLVAYSGGVDSAFLALIATQELGERAVCVTGLSPSVSEFQRAEAAKIAIDFKFNFETIDTVEVEDPSYQANTGNRCYFCKSELYGKLADLAESRNIAFIIDGTNADDTGDHRPGRTAADENKVRSPLVEAGFRKDEIRRLSRDLGLAGWDKPASPCLSSRIAHGVPVTIERLTKVEKGEEFLRQLGFKEFRARVHGELVRIEISTAELEKALNMEMAAKLTARFLELGFRYVTLDMEGFRSGAMNSPEIRYQQEQLEKV